MEPQKSSSLHHELYQKGLFFLSDSTSFSFATTCLADGLHQLGIPVFSNINYHDPLISDFAFTASPPQDTNMVAGVVLDILETAPLHNQLVRFASPHPRTVITCMHDNVGEISFPDHIAFCTHENHFRSITGRRLPIAFGVSSAMLHNAQHLLNADIQRNPNFMANFRPSEGQSLRASLDLSLIPILKDFFSVETKLVGNGRWGSDYFQHLSRQLGCLAYGGYYSQNLLLNDWFHFCEPLNTFLRNTHYHQDTVVLRWDSWRLWESLVFGCVTIHLDFERYGLALPVMPENWKHYIGLNLADLRRDMERLHDERDRLPEIARQGRLWAIEHYSPVAVARRFIATLHELFPVA